MNKVLEALERLAMPDELHIKECRKLGIGLTEDYDVVEQAVLELQAITEANPSEALECVDNLENSLSLANELLRVTDTSAMDKYIATIKQYILKSQEQEKENELLKGQMKYLTEVVTKFQKILKIIKGKNVDLGMVDFFNNVEDYNEWLTLQPNESRKPLSEYEFELIKQ